MTLECCEGRYVVCSQRSIPTRVSRFILIIAQNGCGICTIAQRAERAQSAVWTQFNLDHSR